MSGYLKISIIFLFPFQILNFGCNGNSNSISEKPDVQLVDKEEVMAMVDEDSLKRIIVGAERLSEYWQKIENKSLALVVNQTSMVGDQHLVDTLLNLGAKVQTIFAPEHGFRGDADAGEKIKDGFDAKTGVKIQSLYGKNKKPKPEQLIDIDLVIFDIQDVGARFYTYISTMTYVMEACAENGVGVMILDRPNPNGHFVDGPVLEKEFSSFVGMHEVPIVHGMTIGEYAKMANGEGWLSNKIQCNLEVILCKNYDHLIFYELPIKPSPNLPNMRSIYLYPTLCLFEGTNVSIGRGTDKQFQIMGAPEFLKGDFEFTPRPMPGAKYPKHEGKLCRGMDFQKAPTENFQKSGLIFIGIWLSAFENFSDKNDFFLKNNFFNKLAGNATLKEQILEGKSEKEIRESWEPKLSEFKEMRKKYLLY